MGASALVKILYRRNCESLHHGSGLELLRLDVPAFYLYDWRGLAQIFRVVGCGDLTTLAGQQRKVVVLPKNR
jgi:hypothetical protein